MAVAMLSWLVAIPLLGGLTGLRSMTPIALLCWFAYRGHLDVHGTWGHWSARLLSAGIFTALALGELIVDKLPQTPNRTDAFPLVARIVFGGLVGALCATGLHGSAIEGALLASISAVGGTFLGFHFRMYLIRDRNLSPLGTALVEDAITVGLSILALGIVTG